MKRDNKPSYEELEKENDKLKKQVNKLQNQVKKLNLEAQKYFDMLVEKDLEEQE